MDQGLDAMASPTEVDALVTRVGKAVTSCPKATWTLEGVGSSPVTVKKIQLPQTAGGSHTGFVMTATGGAMRAFEMHCAFVALGDVILSLNTDRQELLASMTTKAVRKAGLKLGVGR